MFDLSNHSLDHKFEINNIELSHTDSSNYYYYIDFLLSNFTKTTNSSNHAIHNYENNIINSHHNHHKNAILNHSTPIINSIHKLKRFACFISFFILFILVISLLSRLYACTTKMKTRKKRYGYYFNFKIETYISDIRNKLKYKQLKLSTNLVNKITRNREDVKLDEELPIYIQDIGHINESYEPNLEQFVYQNSPQVEMDIKPIKKSNFLTNYFETKRANAFEYEKFIDDDANSIKTGRFSLKYLKKPQIKQETSLPLFTISNNNNLFKQITRSTTSFINFNKSKSGSSSISSDTNSVSTNSTAFTMASFEIPIILVTDTTKMQTSVIDMDTFEPEKYDRPHSLLDYRLYDK